MGVGDDSFRCPCCVECTECKDFQKVADIENAGLVIFRHLMNNNYGNEQKQFPESVVSRSEDVFIFQNTKNVDIQSADVMPNLETFKSNCRRCKTIYERAQKLLKGMPIIGENRVMGVCDRCYQKQLPKTCYECEKIVDKFLAARYGERETKNALQTWLSKIKHVLSDATVDEMRTAVTHRASSELNIDKISQFDTISPNKLKEKANIILIPEKRRSDSNILGSHAYTPKYEMHENIKGLLQPLDQSVDFVDSMRVQKKYRPDQRYVGEVFEAAGRAPAEFGGEQRSMFKVPDRSLKKKRDSNIPTTYLFKSKQREDEDIKGSLQTRVQFTGFLDPQIAQQKYREHQEYTGEAFGVGKSAHSGYVASEPRSIFDEPDITDAIEEMRDFNITTSHYKSKHARDKMIKRPLHELDKSVEFKDSKKLRKNQHPDQRYMPEAIEGAKEENAVHPFLDEHSAIGPFLGEAQNKSPTQKRDFFFSKDTSVTSVFDDKQGLGIDQQSVKPSIKRTQVPNGPQRENNLSTDTIMSTISQAALNTSGKELRYFFPLGEVQPRKMKIIPTSSELIQLTVTKIEEDKLRKDAEFEKKNQEKAKLIEEKKRLADEKKRIADEKKRIAEEDKKKRQAEEEKFKMNTKEDENSKNITHANDNAKAKAMDTKEGTEKDGTSASEKGKIKSDGGRSAVEKNKKAKLDQGDKTTGKGNEKLAQEQSKTVKKEEQLNEQKLDKQREKELKESEKQKAQEEKERLKKEKEEQLQKEKLEKQKEKESKIKAKEERDKEKERLQAQEKKEKESTKYTGDTDSKQKQKNEKEIKDDREKESKPRDTDEQQKNVKELTEIRSKKGEDEGMKSTGKHDKDTEEISKDLKRTENEKAKKDGELPSIKPSKANVAPNQQKVDRKDQSERAKDKSEQAKKDIASEKTGEDVKFNILDLRTEKKRPSPEDQILQLVKLKQDKAEQDKKGPKDALNIKEQSDNILIKNPSIVYLDSNSAIGSSDSKTSQKAKQKICDIIVGEKILKFVPPLLRKTEKQAVVPILFPPIFEDTNAPMPENTLQITAEKPNAEQPITISKSSKHPADPDLTKGIMRYALSDRTFIEKGWTMLPNEKVVRKMNVYRMRPAQPEFDWFEHNKNKRLMLYDSGEKLAEFDDNGRGRWYYKNGHLALDYYDAEEINANQRFVLYSNGEPDERGRSRPITVIATFDYLGNGVVFDHAGKIRLKYNQTEGVVLDRGIGPVSHWKWHTLNDPPVLQQVMIDTQMPHKDPNILKLGGPSDKKARKDNDEMLAIEFDNFIKEKSKKLSQSFKPFQIKMKALKINEHFSLKVLDQATVYLIYRDGTTNLKLNIGMVLDHKEIVDTDTAEVGDVSNSLERFPARTESLAGLQRSVAYAQRYERARTERERSLRPLQECASVDRLGAAASRPLQPPLRTVPTGSTPGSECYCRKASSCKIYYNTRLT